MPLSPPVTMRTSFFAVSTMATALSTAACTRSNSPAASPSRCRVEFSVRESCRARPRLAKIPFANPACSGSALAFGKLLTRIVAGSAAAPGDAIIARARIHRSIIRHPPVEPGTRFSHAGVDLSEYAGYAFVYGGGGGAVPPAPFGRSKILFEGKNKNILQPRGPSCPRNKEIPTQNGGGDEPVK